MSSKIYFADNQSRGFGWWLIRLITTLILFLPKTSCLKLAKKLLLKPVRRMVRDLPDGMKLEEISVLHLR